MTQTLGAPDHAASSTPLEMRIYTSPTRPIGVGTGRTFSPITSTIIFGASEAVLVDAQFLRDDVEALGDMIAATGARLTNIFITHGHGDHYFGAGRLIERFPGARVVATSGVVAHIVANKDRDVATWTSMFGDQVVGPTALPTPLESDTINLEGQKLRVIEVGQGDIAPTAILHVPALDAVIAGDVAYNGIHQMLGFSTPDEWEQWIASLDKIEQLHPRIVVAGHKKPEADNEATRVIDQSRAYIRDFANAAESAKSADEIISAIQTKYPDHGNLTTLHYSAAAAFAQKEQAIPS